jgi:uncharacterized protein (DUF58 family)
MSAEDGEGALLEAGFLRRLEQLSHQLQGRARGAQRGERRSNKRGTGGDFAELRPYAAGDDLRHLDWHAYARLDALLVRLYEEPRDHAVYVLVDGSASMGVGKGRLARQLAAALAWLALAGTDRAGLFWLGEGVAGQLGPLRGKAAAHRAVEFLGRWPFGGVCDLRRAAQEFARQPRPGTAWILSDFLVPEGAEAIGALARAGCEVVAVQLLSPQERMPALGQDLTFVDAETGQELVVHVDRALRAAYLARLGALEEALRATCRKHNAAFVPVTSDVPVEELLLGPLRRQGLVGG